MQRYEDEKDHHGVARKLEDDIKLSAVEMMVPADIENHLTLHRYRIKTDEDAIAEIALVLEALTGEGLESTGAEGAVPEMKDDEKVGTPMAVKEQRRRWKDRRSQR